MHETFRTAITAADDESDHGDALKSVQHLDTASLGTTHSNVEKFPTSYHMVPK